MSEAELAPPFEAYSGVAPYAFVSYSHQDKNLAFPELERLTSLGVHVWYDEGIDPGNEWPEEIARALTNCSVFLVMISPRSVESRNVRNEVNFALAQGLPVIAIHLEETVLPPGLALRLGDIQAIMRWRMDEASYSRKLSRVLAGVSRALVDSDAAEPPNPTPSRLVPSQPAEPEPEPDPDSKQEAGPEDLASEGSTNGIQEPAEVTVEVGVADPVEGRKPSVAENSRNSETPRLSDPEAVEPRAGRLASVIRRLRSVRLPRSRRGRVVVSLMVVAVIGGAGLMLSRPSEAERRLAQLKATIPPGIRDGCGRYSSTDYRCTGGALGSADSPFGTAIYSRSTASMPTSTLRPTGGRDCDPDPDTTRYYCRYDSQGSFYSVRAESQGDGSVLVFRLVDTERSVAVELTADPEVAAATADVVKWAVEQAAPVGKAVD